MIGPFGSPLLGYFVFMALMLSQNEKKFSMNGGYVGYHYRGQDLHVLDHLVFQNSRGKNYIQITGIPMI